MTDQKTNSASTSEIHLEIAQTHERLGALHRALAQGDGLSECVPNRIERVSSVFTIDTFSEFFHLSRDKAVQLIRCGDLKASNVSTKRRPLYRILKSDAMAWFESLSNKKTKASKKKSKVPRDSEVIEYV